MMSRGTVFLAIWTLLAGAGIPMIGVLGSGLTRSVGNPITSTAVMFCVALLVAATMMVPLFGLPTFGQLASAPAWSYAAGLLMAFYVLSATIIIPRFGAGNFVAFILVAQLATSATIDQFGLFGMVRRPLDAMRMAGLALVLTGIVMTQFLARPTVLR